MQNQTMKKRLIYILPFLLSAVLFSCRSGNDPFDAGNHRFPWEKKSPVMYTVRLSLDGDYITETEEPLTRDDDKYTYVGINVFSKGEDDSEYKNYAYGLYKYRRSDFDPSQTGITINLLSTDIYKFKATVLKDDTDVLSHTGANSYKPGYGEPFRVHPSNGEYEESKLCNDNGFIYTSDVNIDDEGQFVTLSSGKSFVTIDGLTGYQAKKASGFPRVKRFYGYYDDGYNPVENASLIIPMDYTCFGLKFEVENEGMPAGTYLTVEDNNWYEEDPDLKIFPTDGKIVMFPESLKLGIPSDDDDQGILQSWSGVYSMNNLLPGATDSFTLRFTWHRGSGVTEVFTHTVPGVKAGKMKVLKINVSGTTVTNPEGTISFTMGSEDLTIDPDAVTISNIN